MIHIVSKKEGFRRCGVAHAKGPVEYEDDHWDKKQLKALQAEPMLVVTSRDGLIQRAQDAPAPETDTNATPATGKEPKEPAPQVAMDDIVAAIGRLSIDNLELWSASSGKPHVKAVEAEFPEGANINSAQRDEAWKIFQPDRMRCKNHVLHSS